MAWRRFVLVCAKLNSNKKTPRTMKNPNTIKDFVNHSEILEIDGTIC